MGKNLFWRRRKDRSTFAKALTKLDSIIPQRIEILKKYTSSKKRIVKFSTIINILNYGYEGNSFDDDGSDIIEARGTLEEYIEWVEEIIRDEGLEENIEIIKLENWQRNPLSGIINNIYGKNYKILIKNLFISGVSRFSVMALAHHSFFFSYVIFENNTFNFPLSEGIIYFLVKHKIKFNNNIFNRADVILKTNYFPKRSQISNPIKFIELVGNVFKGDFLTINGGIRTGYRSKTSAEWTLPSHSISKFFGSQSLGESVSMKIECDEEYEHAKGIYEKYNNLVTKITKSSGNCTIKDLLQYLHYESKSFTPTLDNIEPIPDNARIVSRDNKIKLLNITPITPIHFEGVNRIDDINFYNIEGKDIEQNIIWGQYQKIIHKKENAQKYKNFFIALKEIAIKNSDKEQEFILNREVLKCDHHLIKAEPFWHSLQDRLIMDFGKWSSNHGISLIRPIIGISVINALLALLVTHIVEINFLPIFVEMFNPISNLNDTASARGNIAVLIINLFQKAVFAVLLYELIRVGRRFVAK